jgi:hypothetical protein
MMVGSLYIEQLSDSDLGLLASAAGAREDVRRDPARLEALIDSPATFRQLFSVPGRDPLLQGTPFLIFAVLIHRVVRDLSQASFIDEWVGPRQRVPVFDTAGLKDFGADPLRRFFLVQLLASYTNVASGSMLVKTSRGWRRRRFSELDPMGIFPDYAAERLVADRDRRGLERALGPTDREQAEGRDGIWLLEQLGRRAYRIARKGTDRGAPMAGVLADVSENFADARRVLNFLTDRYLYPMRRQWFGAD